MFYDLNVPWQADKTELEKVTAFLDELGYGTIALTHTYSGKLPADIAQACPIPKDALSHLPKLNVLRRCNVILSDTSQNHRLPALATIYDLVAIRPTNQDTLQAACNNNNLEVDIISVDLSQRLGYHFKHKTCASAIQRGIRFEICYAPSIAQSDSSGTARRNLICNATSLIRATRGRNIIISSEATRALAVRAPQDMINMAVIWGLSQEKGQNALDREAKVTVLSADLKRRRFRGVVEIVGTGNDTGNRTKKGAATGESSSVGAPIAAAGTSALSPDELGPHPSDTKRKRDETAVKDKDKSKRPKIIDK